MGLQNTEYDKFFLKRFLKKYRSKRAKKNFLNFFFKIFPSFKQHLPKLHFWGTQRHSWRVMHKIKVVQYQKCVNYHHSNKITGLKGLKISSDKKVFKCRTSQPCILPLDTFWVAKYPKTVQFSSVIPFWKAIKLTIPELLSVL